ncbi:MAG: signal peptidase I [Patescibacteria group bacterium]
MKNSQKGSVIIWVVVIVAILIIAVAFYSYKSGSRQPTEYQQQAQAPTTNVATTTIMQGVAMQPTYKQGAILKVSRDVSEIQRGQVIVFKHASNPNADFIKRVIGLPGETVSITGGIIHINDKSASITQIPTVKGADTISSVKLGSDEYYVLGDNTIQSADSRALGPIKIADITGIVTGVLQQTAPVNTQSTTIVPESQTGVKVFACDNSVPPKGETNLNGKVAALKSINYELMAYLNNHSSYPTGLANFDNYGTKQDFSGTGYLYAYYPKVNPTHYHLGMKIQYGADCNEIIAAGLKTKANFNSKSAGYTNGFDGTDATILDFHDSQNN